MDQVKGDYVGGEYYVENFLKLIPVNQLLITIKL